MKRNTVFTTRNLVLMGVMAALSAILMLFDFPVFFAPGFYKLDVSEVPVLIGAFAMGPLAGVVIEFMKILLNLLLNGSATMCVGELSNFICGVSFVVPAALIYHHKKTKKNALIGLGIGVLCLSVVACLSNIFLIIPAYVKFNGFPLDSIIGAGTEKNSAITGMTSFILLAVLPFNLLKGGLAATITAVLYKHVAPFIKGQHALNKARQ